MKVVRVVRYFYVDELAIDERRRSGNDNSENEIAEEIALDWFNDEFIAGEIDTDSFSVEFVKDE
ncbi:MAG: hypothetical protein FWC41_03220 [Firmicutes bacterium]|nr:hypothetical protein [Bacillota bacterium]